MDIERGLLTAIVHDDEIAEVHEARITESFFHDDEHLLVWRLINEHWTKHSKLPDFDVVKAHLPTWKQSKVDQPVSYFIEQMQDRRRHEIVEDAVIRASDALGDGDLDDAVTAITTAAQDVNTQVSGFRNDDLTQDTGKRMALWDDLARNPGMLRGMSTGFAVIDRATRGIQPEQYIVLAGAQKSYKSTILLHMAIHANEVHNVKGVLISFEMSREEQWARHDAIRAGISPRRLLDGRLTAKERRRLDKSMENLPDYESLILATDISALTTVSGIRAIVEQEKPGILYVDGVYLMEDQRGERTGTPQALTNISRDIKRMCQATKVPTIVTTQALENKMTKAHGISPGAVGYTSAFGQDCDMMLGSQRVPDEEDVVELRVMLSRSGPLAKTRARIDWETSTMDEYDPDDEPEDDEEDDEPRRGGRGGSY